MSESLREKVEALRGSAWSPCRTCRRDGKDDESPSEERQWASLLALYRQTRAKPALAG